ncbi:hypothetical protein J5N97_021345 [Dioscorea zingiberensis]|uniref:F-box protein n=1 Tax=Dioscorea zingiberensis TaxID=325984 RepID=A0A9D5CHF0_9LILI|nr:hypothetical protein J5N97_021345 [Dioscorea zingiberensis]
MALATTTIEDLHPELVEHTLRRLDGPTLAAASCATMHLRSLARHRDVWRDLCLTTWPSIRHHPGRLQEIIPSFPDSHRSFFGEAYPFPFISSRSAGDAGDDTRLPRELISAVDIYYRGVPVLSCVVETETESQWFNGSPFRVDVLDRKDPDHHGVMESVAVVAPGELTLSWIVIDPEGRKAVNLSSRRPVAVDRHWYTGETVVRYAMASRDGSSAMIGVTVACEEDGGHVREVSLMLEDEDGICLNGKESLAVIKEAMEGVKIGRGRGEEEEEAKRRYEEHMKKRKERKDRRARSETRIDTCCIAIGVSIFLAFMVLVVFR